MHVGRESFSGNDLPYGNELARKRLPTPSADSTKKDLAGCLHQTNRLDRPRPDAKHDGQPRQTVRFVLRAIGRGVPESHRRHSGLASAVCRACLRSVPHRNMFGQMAAMLLPAPGETVGQPLLQAQDQGQQREQDGNGNGVGSHLCRFAASCDRSPVGTEAFWAARGT